MSLGVAIGAITFTGSVIAFLKLSGRMSGKPITLPGRHIVNLALLAALVFFIYGFFVSQSAMDFWIIVALSLALCVGVPTSGSAEAASTVKVAFSLAFAEDKGAPDTGFFTCQQHYPENFWNPAFQQHANGVTGVAGVVFVADNPSDHHIFLKAFAGVSDLTATSTGIAIETPRGEIQAMDPAAYRLHFAVAPPDTSRGMRLAAIRFAARDMETVRKQAGASAIEQMGKLIIAPAAAHGATLVFER